MLHLTEVLPADDTALTIDELVLPFGQRCRSRFRATGLSGREFGVTLQRGEPVLLNGQLLASGAGECVRIRAANESLYRVQAQPESADAALDLLRAAYHLGNRHVRLQVLTNELRLEPDPVLRQMLERLGLSVLDVLAPFEPELGAYGGGHKHDHDHHQEDHERGNLGEELSRQAHKR